MAEAGFSTKPLRLLVVGMGEESITFLDRLINGLAGKSIEIILASPRKPQPGRFSPSEWVRWLWAPDWDTSFANRLFYLLRLLGSSLFAPGNRWLKQEVKSKPTPREKLITLYQLLPFTRISADIIYFPWNTTAITYEALYRLGIPVVLSCRGSQINIRPHTTNDNVYARRLRDSLENAAVVHCVSGAIKTEALQLGLPPENGTVIHPSVDPDFFCPAVMNKTRQRLLIITTGSLIWRKGYEYALLAIRHLVDYGVDCEFQIIGGGPEKTRLLYTIQDLGLEQHVSLLGALPPAEVVKRLQAADIFLLSSLSEGVSNAVLEAMSCALAVVTTNCGGMREAVTDGVEGFVVPLRDPAAMAEKLLLLARSPSARAQMGAAGRERVLKDFNLRYQINAFHLLFTTLADRK